MTAVPVVGALVVATLRGMVRDRSSIVYLVVLPMALMVLMGNIYASEDGSVPSLGVLVEDAGPTGAMVDESLRSSGALEVVAMTDREHLDDAVRRRHVDAGFVIGEDRSAALVGPPQVQLPGGIRFVVGGAVDRAERAVRLAAVTGRPVEAVFAELPSPVAPPVEDPDEARTEAAIGVLVLVTFMNLIAYGSMVPSHRTLGVFGRLRAVPAGRGAVLLAYAITFTAVAFVQVTIALLAGRVLVGIDWGPTVPVIAVTAGLAVAAGGIGTLAATLLPTPESGSTIGGPVGFALGMLGGCLWPLAFVGGALEAIGQWVPHQWAVAALREISYGYVSPGRLAVQVGGLLLAGVIGAALGSRRLATSWG